MVVAAHPTGRQPVTGWKMRLSRFGPLVIANVSSPRLVGIRFIALALMKMK